MIRELLTSLPTLKMRPVDAFARRVEHALHALGRIPHVNERPPLPAAAVDGDATVDIGILGHDVDGEIEARAPGDAEKRRESQDRHAELRARRKLEQARFGLGLAARVERDRVQRRVLRHRDLRARGRRRCTTRRRSSARCRPRRLRSAR